MSIADFREELADKINTIDGISCGPYLTDSFAPPTCQIDYEVGEAIALQHGAYELTFHVALIYGRSDEKSAQQFFDLHRDPQNTTGLFRVLTDASWTNADYVRATGAGGIQGFGHGGAEYLMVDFTLEVVL
jgi:hypothetical protein